MKHTSQDSRCIRPTKCVHPTCKSCTSGLQNVCNQLSKVVHPTYKKCASVLQKVCIRPTKTNNICSSCVGRINKIECTSDLQLSKVRYCSKSEVSQDGSTARRTEMLQDRTVYATDSSKISINFEFNLISAYAPFHFWHTLPLALVHSVTHLLFVITPFTKHVMPILFVFLEL